MEVGDIGAKHFVQAPVDADDAPVEGFVVHVPVGGGGEGQVLRGTVDKVGDDVGKAVVVVQTLAVGFPGVLVDGDGGCRVRER